MSGLYNTVFGVNELAAPLLRSLKIDKETFRTIPRFRDCFLSESGTEIIIYTRTGGGNRNDYIAENEAMRRLPGYLRDEDDSFDSTYALFFYAVPESEKETCLKLGQIGMGVNPSKRWQEVIGRLSDAGAK